MKLKLNFRNWQTSRAGCSHIFLTHSHAVLGLLVAAALSVTTPSSQAANATWTGTTDGKRE